MNDTRQSLKFLLKRLLIALPLIIVFMYLMIPLRDISFFAAFLLVPVGLLLAKPLTELIGSGTSSILFPTTAGREVNLMFSIAESRVMETKYDEALYLYEDMIPKDPDRLEIYIRIIDLAIYKMKRPEIAREALRKGLTNLKEAEERIILAKHFKRIQDL